MEGLIAVTGATGWVGRTAIDELQRSFSPEEFKARIRAFGSRTGNLKLMGGIILPVLPLADLPILVTHEPIGAILHSAFLTPDRLHDLGEDAYVSTNRQITDWVVKALKASKATRVVEISSGAAELMEAEQAQGGGRLSASLRLYGSMKLNEEHLLATTAPTLILRIYALSGRWIRHPSKYALGHFLLQAAAGKRITIKASHPVIRGYGHAGDLTQLSIRWLLSDETAPDKPISTVNETVELANLACFISKKFNLPEPIINIDPLSLPDSYTTECSHYVSMANSHLVPLKSLEDQLKDTFEGVSNANTLVLY